MSCGARGALVWYGSGLPAAALASRCPGGPSSPQPSSATSALWKTHLQYGNSSISRESPQTQSTNSVPLPGATDYRKRNVKSCQVFPISCYSPWPFYITPCCLDTIKIPWIAASPTLRLGESVITLPGSSFPTLSVLDSSPSSGYHEQFLSQPWGYFPTFTGYPLSYMIHWEMIYTSLPEDCISNWKESNAQKTHFFLLLRHSSI